LGQERFTPTWLSLDRDDNDLGRFLMYLVAALQRVPPDMDSVLPGMLQTPQPSPAAAFATLNNEIAAVSAEVLLVLDD
jgi:LuxR family maltose regulon positive regulatory protein